MGLVWNSMMSMAGGWFFLMINESFRLGDHDFRLPGLGSYMSVGRRARADRSMALAVLAMMLMIVALDQLLWRPVVVWAQRFRVEETARQPTRRGAGSCDLVRRSRLVRRLAATGAATERGDTRTALPDARMAIGRPSPRRWHPGLSALVPRWPSCLLLALIA